MLVMALAFKKKLNFWFVTLDDLLNQLRWFTTIPLPSFLFRFWLKIVLTWKLCEGFLRKASKSAQIQESELVKEFLRKRFWCNLSSHLENAGSRTLPGEHWIRVPGWEQRFKCPSDVSHAHTNAGNSRSVSDLGYILGTANIHLIIHL